MDSLAGQHDTRVPLRRWLENRPSVQPEKFIRLACQMAHVVAALHASGKWHGCLALEAFAVSPDNNVELWPRTEEPASTLQLDEWRCPPELRGRAPLLLPRDLAAANLRLADWSPEPDVRRIDTFQLAACIVELVTGADLEAYLSQPRVAQRLPVALCSVVDRALGYSPAQRIGTCEQLAHELAAISGDSLLGRETPSAGVQTPATDTKAGGHLGRRSLSVAGAKLPFSRLGIYTIVGHLGSGGMGDVYKGYDAALDRFVAIKVLPAELARHADFVARFRSEAAAAARVEHPNIVPIYAIGEDEGHQYFAMLLVQGPSLADLLEEDPRPPIGVVLHIVEQVLAGLAAAHRQGLIHRDIKPSNILLTDDGQRALVADFGLVKNVAQTTRMTATGVVMGTVDYISPEQGRGLAVDQRSDLYSTGVLLYRMLAGRLPFAADTPTAMIFQHVYEQPPRLEQVAPHVPPALAEIVHRLLAKDPAQRFPSCEQLLHALQNAHAAMTPDLLHGPERLPKARRETTIVFAPQFGPEPAALWAEVDERAYRAGLALRLWSWISRQAPPIVRHWQTTQQQVVAAVEEYEQRCRMLTRLIQEGEDVLRLLERQHAEQRKPFDAAGADLDQQIAQQREQLEAIRLCLARATARLAQLRSQGDALQARLKLAQARYELAAGGHPRREVSWRAAIWLLAMGGLLTLVAVWYVRRGPQGATTASVTESPVTSGAAADASSFTSTKRQPLEAIVDESGLTATLPQRIQVMQSVGSDGSLQVIAGAEDGSLYVLVARRDHLQSREFERLEAHTRAVRGLAWNERTRRLASAADDGDVLVWDWTRRAVYRRLPHGEALHGLAFSPDGSQLLTSGASGTRCWDVVAGSELQRYVERQYASPPNSFAWLPDGSGFVLGMRLSGGPSTVLVSIDGSRWLRLQDVKSATSHLAVLEGGTRATGVSFTGAFMWRLSDGEVLFTYGEQPTCAAYPPWRTYALLGSSTGLVSLWSLADGKKLEDLGQMQGRVSAVAISLQGDLALASHGNNVSLFKLPDERVPHLRDSRLAPSPIRVLAFSPHEFVALSAGPQEVRHWNLKGSGVNNMALDGAAPASMVLFMPDGTSYLVARPTPGRDGYGELTLRPMPKYPIGANTVQRRYRGHQGGTLAAAIVRNGTRIISGGQDNYLRIWDVAREQELAAIDVRARVRLLAATQDAKLVAVASDEPQIAVWDIDDKQLAGTLAGHSLSVRSMVIAKNSPRLATVSGDRTAKVWDLNTRQLLATLEHPAGVSAVDISDDGQWMVTGSDDGSLRLWNIGDQRAGEVIWAHQGSVQAVALAPDGRTMLSSGEDQRLNWWDVPYE